MKRTIEQVDVDGKRVLMRVDFNVPICDGEITDDRRIQLSLPSIECVLQRGGTVTLMSHLGRPSGLGVESQFSLEPVSIRLSELLHRPVSFGEDDPEAEIVLLENLRFNFGEETGDADFAAQLASLGDIYCNNAFGTAHRTHASMVALPEAMEGKPRVVGMLMANELQFFVDTVEHAQRPFVALLGGAKVSDKMHVIRHLLDKVDTILIGGAMSYTFLAAGGTEVGESLVEHDRLQEANEILDVAAASDTALLLPCDHVCAKRIAQDPSVKVVSDSIPNGWMGLDIGPETQTLYSKTLLLAKTILWNGPMGVFETEPFDVGTAQVAKAISKATTRGAISIVGGGDTAAAVSSIGLESQITHISTGGGASLQLLAGKSFKSVEMLDNAV